MLRDAFREKRVTVEKSYRPGASARQRRRGQDAAGLPEPPPQRLRGRGRGRADLGDRWAPWPAAGGGGTYVVRISDNGCGIPEKDWENIFEPFFTTKSSGFGLGLANARKIVEQHGGTIRVVRKRGKGSAFVVTLPREEGQ